MDIRKKQEMEDVVRWLESKTKTRMERPRPQNAGRIAKIALNRRP